MKRIVSTLFLILLIVVSVACGGDEENTPAPTAESANRPADSTSSNSNTDNQPADAAAPTISSRTAVAEPVDWTVLVYLDGDNNLEQPGIWDVNEMESAGSSDRVNVLVQLDRTEGYSSDDGNWTGTRRYKITADTNLNRISSTVLTDLGEVNMGDPNTLADFVAWGIASYPAEHYALVLWNHGSGWLGIAFDDTTSDADGLTMPEIDQALTQALNETGVEKLDIIGFDACLMAQIDVFQRMVPFAKYSVASEEVVPGLGWDYEAILQNLYADPTMDGKTWAGHLVSDYLNFYEKESPDEFVTMSAVDLSMLPFVTGSLESLAKELQTNPTAVASAIGDARNGAEGYALMYPEDANFYASIDMGHFLAILSQLSSGSVKETADAVLQAMQNAIITAGHGAGFSQANGISLYFPRTAEFFSTRYRQESNLTFWNDFLASYHGVGLANIGAPQLNIVNTLSDQAGIQNPAYMDVEITGQDIQNVLLVAGRYENGLQHLLQYDFLLPEPTTLPDGSQLYEWRDGLHKDFFVWQTDSTYLYDANGNGDFAAMFPSEYNSPLYTIQGRYRRAGSDTYFDANLVFDTQQGVLSGVWTYQAEARSAPNELFPEPGDEFQIYNLLMDAQGNVTAEPGTTVTFDNNRQVYYAWQTLPSDNYFLGFSATSISGESTYDVRDFQVNNDNLLSGYRAYLDPYLGFQFLYPDSWFAPSYSDGHLFTSDNSGNTVMNLYLYPNAGGTSPNALKQETLAAFGNPELAFENDITIGGTAATGTVYTYEGSNGAHTGFLLTFVQNGVGYVLDIDGPTTAEETTSQIVATFIDSWVFQPVGFGLPGSVGETAVPAPAPAEETTVNLYQDSFDTAGSWGVGSGDGVNGQVTGGVYDLSVSADSGLYWTTGGQDFADGTYEVTATAVAGPLNNGFGLVFRANNDTNDFYVFEISSDGYAWLGWCGNGCESGQALVNGGWFQTSAVQQGLNQPNYLRVVAEGPNLVFFVNGIEIGRFTDTSLTTGDIGLFVETLGEPGAQVQFDDFIFTPGSGKGNQ